jgi:hypothetical protein
MGHNYDLILRKTGGGELGCWTQYPMSRMSLQKTVKNTTIHVMIFLVSNLSHIKHVTSPSKLPRFHYHKDTKWPLYIIKPLVPELNSYTEGGRREHADNQTCHKSHVLSDIFSHTLFFQALHCVATSVTVQHQTVKVLVM